ncbi:uncharacterized protein LOC116029430 isoform X2 [Ipomoea triloba]|uniref:uncharacterized protein LOC116029430 isoform X2 n=1 Tax=Ipomoea triloba TaxID=35885 RepID=UPI00125D7B8C|nr:uncharacterized protein LOC116029430 isoform X2 [Ipomoea triloba]
MGVQLQDIGVQMRKVLIFSTRACYKIVCNHPILVGLLCFLALLYRSFPFVFSVLLSLSPVLVCTAVLLGTLLSFGQPNIPEIEREEKTVHDIVVPLKIGVLQDDTVVEKDDESYSVDRYTTNETDTVDQSIEELGLGVNKLCEVERGDSFGDDAPLLENESREIELESRMFLEGGRELYGLGSEQKNGKIEERLDDGEILDHQYSPLPNVDDENLEFDNEKSVDSFDSRTVYIGSPVIDREILDRQYSPIPNMDDENLEFDNDKSVDSFDSKMVNVDSPPGSPLKQEEEEEEEDEEEEDDEESLDSGSDRAESSSPDASMADIIPMLDELHPLLDEDTPQPINLLHDGSDAASECSKSCDSDQESDDGTENQEVEAGGDDEKGEGKETTKDKQEQTESAISWTEEDQKNLMDLGSSELERNQRLESLIARRRARKSMRTMVERNLIDLESVDLPFNIAPISTARKNPFDLPGDQYDLGLPPIPGSAPSVLQPRRNPFDLPYDSSEEKPDLKEDSFQQEFKTSHAKESFFRRHESFNVRPSLFGPSRHEKKDILLRPYFVPEEMDSEGSSHSRFQRQSSELSDSRVSSIPETESVASAIDLEDKSLIKEETEDKNLSDEDLVDKDLIYKHSSEDQALISEEEHTSRHVEHGSQSSEVDSRQMGAADWKDSGVDEAEMKWESEENHHRVEPSLMLEGYAAKALDLTVTEIHSKSESLEQHSRHSSSSSHSEEGEKIFDDSETHWLSGLGERRDHSESVISREASLGGADFDIRGTSVDENQYWEPVYDLSPTPLKEISSSSVARDVHVESELGLSPVLVDRTLSPPDMEAVESGQEIEKSTPISDEMLASSPNSQPVEEDELISEDAMLLKNNEVSNLESSENCEVSFSGDPVVTGGVVREDSLDSKASVNTSADQNILDQQGRVEHVLDTSLYSNFDTDIYLDAQHAEVLTMGSVSKSTEAQGIDLFENEEHSSTAVQVSLVQPCTTFENPSLGNNQIDMEVAGIHLEHNGVHLSNLDALTDKDPLSEGPISPQYQCSSTEKSFSQSDKELPPLDCKDHSEMQEPPLIVMESDEEASSTGQLNNVLGFRGLDCEAQPITAAPSSPPFASILHKVDEVTEDAGQSDIHESVLDEVQNDNHIDALKSHQFFTEAIEFEDTDGIEEIDEGILSELDAVGDFSIKESISSLNEFDSGIDSSGVYKNEEKIECGSEFFTPGVSLKEDVDSSSTGFAEREFQESGDRKSAKEESLLTGNDWEPHGVNLNSNTEETNPGMPLVEAQSLKDLEAIYEQAKLESVETEVAFGLSQSPQEVQLLQNSNTEDVSPGLPLVEASSVKDLEAIYEQAKLSTMETKVGLGPSELNQDSNTEDADPGMPLVEANSLKDLESIYEQAKLDSMETNLVLELPELNQNSNAEDADPGMPLVEASSLKDLESIYEQAKSNSMETEVGPGLSELNQNSNTDDTDPGMPLVEASSLSDLESIYEQAKSNSLETELPQEVQLEADTDSGMPKVVAQSIEDLDSVFRQIDSKECEKHDLLDPSHTDSGMSLPEVQSIQDTGSAFDQIDSKGNEKHDSLHPPHAEEASGESENSKNVTLQEHSSLIENEIKFEARSTEDTDSDHLQLHESDPERHILRDSLVGDADALESLHVGAPSHEREMETDSALKQETEDNAEKPMKSSLSSQDVLVEATHNVEGDSSKGTSSVKDRDVPEDGNGSTKNLNFEVDDKSEYSDLATSAEKGDQETPEGDSSSAMDVKAKKEESPGDSHSE